MTSAHLNNRILTFLFAAASLTACTSAFAFTTALQDRFAFSINVAPRISAVGTPRSLFANGCTGSVTLDESAVATTGTLVMRMTPEATGCIERTVVLKYTPRNISTLRVVMKMPDGGIVAEAAMETVAGARSTVNLDGMWFDPATNGSGISFHHSVSSDTVFGTWFLYGAAYYGSRWYSLQSMQWTKGGTMLAGLAYEATADNVRPSCVAGDDCPRPAFEINPVGTVSISVIDQDNLRVEAFDRYGRTAFVSLLKRLAF